MLRGIASNQSTVFHLSAGKNLPEFLKTAKNGVKSLKKDDEYRQRLELIQDLHFPVSCSRIRVSEDGGYLGAIGLYPPEIRVFDTDQLALKFSRGFDCEPVDFIFLTEDFKKLVCLHSDRTLEFHAQGGRHHRLRVPRTGRALNYIKETAELLVVGSSNEILRLDLEAGAFMAPVKSQNGQIDCCALSPRLPLVCVGGPEGIVEAYDTRQWNAAAHFVASPGGEDADAITALAFSPDDGKYLCVGTERGVVKVFDIRSTTPVATRDHRNLLPIVDLQAVKASPTGGSVGGDESPLCVVSADKTSVKIWTLGPGGQSVESARDSSLSFSNGEHDQTRLLASLEPEAARAAGNLKLDEKAGSINSVTVYPDSGLVFLAQDNPRIGVYFVSALGVAPRWCAFLDSLTEEGQKERGEAVYEDFQFVTHAQLVELGAEHLIGTSVLKAYMHGYFMGARLYEKLRAASRPYIAEEARKRRIQERIDRKAKMRIHIKQKLPSVNKELAMKLVAKGKKAKVTTSQADQSILSDDRFKDLFTNPDYAVEVLSIQQNAKPEVRKGG